MQAYKVFKKAYSVANLIKHYEEKIYNNCSAGLDKVSPLKFEEDKENIIKKASEKVLSGTYKFTRYKKMLILKGEKKHPRVICLPTVRDKLVLSSLNEMLTKLFGDAVITSLPQVIINHIFNDLRREKYDSFIKIDIKTFYASINHDVLRKNLRNRIRKPEIISLIEGAVKTPSIETPVKTREKVEFRKVGIPEGISISNILANIYLKDIDNKYAKSEKFSYHRYVDDILILCDNNDLETIKKELLYDLEQLKLETNEKEESGVIENGFEYLGYRFDSKNISVRESSILKYESSLEQVFSSYKHADNPSIELFEWKLNLKVTGCVIDGKKYGWLYYFSQIDDMNLITHLDLLIKRLFDRFNIEKANLNIKRFKRTFYEIRYRLHSSNYIPNFDMYSIDDIKKVLERIYKKDLGKLNDEQIIILFKKIMSKETRELEKDVQFFS